MSCQVCGVASTGGQFCVACGQPLAAESASTATAVATRERARPARSTWLDFQEIRLLACPKCGAPNSAARWQCARCGETFDERAVEEVLAEIPPTVDEAPVVQSEPAPWLGLITVVAGVAVVAVAVVMLASRGVGPFGSDETAAPVTQATQAGIEQVRASDLAAASGVQRNVADGDTATAWWMDGEVKDEWIELRLDTSVQIDHLLVWNGDQRDDDSFAAANRVRDVLISFPDVGKRYTARFANVNANFRVDMPDPPVSKRIRIKILSVYGGDAERTAISEIEALVNSSSSVPVDG
ncbi:hypothetical protein BH23ACT10_BH23ACT10_36630 [soil metagenome]